MSSDLELGQDYYACMLKFLGRLIKNNYFHSSPSPSLYVVGKKFLYYEVRKHHGMVYQNQLDEQWHCAWCNYTAKEFDRVVDHENDVHVGKHD
ncbi:MAG: hypothetical protein JSV05_01780 [Candidatus Bathyarchaeota archaeon]|nr:MAG: hypothetical protein JSV05_01780 [Candidatus Bathyarchaeota archaeon]